MDSSAAKGLSWAVLAQGLLCVAIRWWLSLEASWRLPQSAPAAGSWLRPLWVCGLEHPHTAFPGHLGSLTSWWLGSKSKWSKRIRPKLCHLLNDLGSHRTSLCYSHLWHSVGENVSPPLNERSVTIAWQYEPVGWGSLWPPCKHNLPHYLSPERSLFLHELPSLVYQGGPTHGPGWL